MNRNTIRTLPIALLLLTVFPLWTRSASAASLPHNMTVEGLVTTDRGIPVAGALIDIAGVTAQTTTLGTYTLQMPQPAGSQSVTAWAPGYREQFLKVGFPAANEVLDDVILNFTGPFALTSAFTALATGATLQGLSVTTTRHQTTEHLHGSAGGPLESALAVTLPNGRVRTYPLHQTGGMFSATLPFHALGPYRVEINATSGLPIFNVVVFHGVAPFLPPRPAFPSDPVGASAAQLARFVVGLVNQARGSAHLTSVRLDRRLTRAATAHNDEMARLGYVLVHPHIGANGSTLLQRIQQRAPNARRVGETVAEYDSASQGIAGLLDSPGHRAIFLGKFRRVGIAVRTVSSEVLLTIDWAG